MINQSSIDDFLKRQLDNFDWMKNCGHKSLDAEIAQMRPVPDFGKIVPWLHQKVCFLLCNELQRFMLHVDMGGGKTSTVLLLLKYRKQCGEKIKAIVFVPYITSVSTWIDEVATHAPDLKCVPLLGTTAENLARLRDDGDLFVICYQSAVAMVTGRVPGKKGKIKWKLNASDVRKHFSGFNALIMDEVHTCRNANSLSYRMCRAISSQCDWVLGLTGTPFGKDLADLWPQFYLIDFGDTLGPTLGFFREAFFSKKPNYWGGFEYSFKSKLLPVLKRMIKNCSIRYEIDELHDMPEKRYVPRYLPLPEGSEGYAKEALARMREAAKGTGPARYQAVESNYLRLRQLGSGFMTFKGDDNSRLQVQFDTVPKLDALEALISGIPSDRKVVIFHHFIFTNKMISERLTAMGVKHARVWSGQKDPLGELKRFKSDPTCRALVINSKSGSSSLNLQFANYIVFYEQPDSPIDRQQAERRCWRPGQKHKVIIYDFLVRKTADVTLHKSNLAGQNLLRKLLNRESVL